MIAGAVHHDTQQIGTQQIPDVLRPYLLLDNLFSGLRYPEMSRWPTASLEFTAVASWNLRLLALHNGLSVVELQSKCKSLEVDFSFRHAAFPACVCGLRGYSYA